MKRLYCVAMSAQGVAGIFVAVTHLGADSEEEAKRIGMQMAFLKAPSDDGWAYHTVVVSDIPQDIIDTYATQPVPDAVISD